MVSDLPDASLVQNDDPVRFLDRGQPVRNRKGRAVFYQMFQ